MKKKLSILLAMIMVIGVLAGCGGSGSAAKTEPSGADSTSAAADGADDFLPADIKVGFIMLHDENSTYDLNFINAAKAACAKLGISEDNYLIRTNIPEGQECYDAAADLVDAGCGIIFADSFGHEDFMIQAAKEFPDVQFCHATGTKAHTEGLPNSHNAFASIYEGRYLAGVAAGMKLNEMIESGKIKEDEAKIGYVGAFTYAEVISGYTSFFLGARSICPSATMEVTFTGSWYDETAEKEGATTLINDGCVLISQHAVSSRINWEPYYEYAITAAAAGEEIEADYTGTISTGSVELNELNEQAAAEGTAEKIAEVQAQLENEEVYVFDTSKFTVDGKNLDSYKADVDTDANYEADTEVVSDGYFHESEYRSAPYFDLRIDGITLLDEKY